MEAQFDFQLRIIKDNVWDYAFTDIEDLQDCIDGTANLKNSRNSVWKFIKFDGSRPNMSKYLDDLGGLQFSQTRRFNKSYFR